MADPDDPTIEQLNRLLAECEQLVSTCQALSGRVKGASDELAGNSVPFDSSLLHSLIQLRERYDVMLECLPAELTGRAAPGVKADCLQHL